MSLLYIVFTPQAKEVAEKALETSPYNAVAYGVLVGVLILALILLWKEYKEAVRRHRDQVEKTVGLIQVVESKLDSIEDLERENYKLRNKVSDLEVKIGQLSEYINLLRQDESN